MDHRVRARFEQLNRHHDVLSSDPGALIHLTRQGRPVSDVVVAAHHVQRHRLHELVLEPGGQLRVRLFGRGGNLLESAPVDRCDTGRRNAPTRTFASLTPPGLR